MAERIRLQIACGFRAFLEPVPPLPVTSDGRIRFDVGFFKRAPFPSARLAAGYNVLHSLSSPVKTAAVVRHVGHTWLMYDSSYEY